MMASCGLLERLPKGLLDQARHVAQELHISEQEAFEHIIRFGLETDHDDTYIAAIKQAFTLFFNDVIFTLQSFVMQAKPPQSINKIIIFGTSATIKGLPQLITDLSHIKSEIFQINGLIHNGFGVSAKSAIPQANMVSLATALPISQQRPILICVKKILRFLSQSIYATIYHCLQLLAGLILGSLYLAMRSGKSENY